MAKPQQRRLEDLEKKIAAKANTPQMKRWQALMKLGGGVYETPWIRKQYGIEDPVSEAIDEWWAAHRNQSWDKEAFQLFLMEKMARDPERFERVYGEMPPDLKQVLARAMENGAFGR